MNNILNKIKKPGVLAEILEERIPKKRFSGWKAKVTKEIKETEYRLSNLNNNPNEKLEVEQALLRLRDKRNNMEFAGEDLQTLILALKNEQKLRDDNI